MSVSGGKCDITGSKLGQIIDAFPCPPSFNTFHNLGRNNFSIFTYCHQSYKYKITIKTELRI